MKPRKTQPTAKSKYSDEQSYRVWALYRSYDEDPTPWKCVGLFIFLQECLDYIAYCQDSGTDVVFQSPADCRMIRSTDRRVVYKADAAELATA